MKTHKLFQLMGLGAFCGMCTSVDAASVFYESFDYAPGNLQDVSTWSKATGSANENFVVQATGLNYGTLPTSGAHVQSLITTGGDRGYTRNDVASTLSGAGLLADGQTVWMSAVVQPLVGANSSLVVRLGTDYVNGFYSTAGTADSVGFNFQNGSDLQTRYHVNGGAGPNGVIGNNSTLNVNRLVVIEMIWNANNASADTLNYYLPDAALNLGASVNTLNVAFDQATFDTFSVSGSNPAALLDEIRFGATYDDVITNAAVAVPEPSSLALLGLSGLALLRRRR